MCTSIIICIVVCIVYLDGTDCMLIVVGMVNHGPFILT